MKKIKLYKFRIFNTAGVWSKNILAYSEENAINKIKNHYKNDVCFVKYILTETIDIHKLERVKTSK